MPNFAPQPNKDGKIMSGGQWVTAGQPLNSPANSPKPEAEWSGSSGAGVAQPHLASLNNSGPTDTKQFFDENKSVWTNPSGGEVNAWGLVNQYTDPNNRAQISNNSQDWYQQYAGSMPNISAEPGFGAYFDNAKNRAAESINQVMAARGAYGSTAANDQTSRAFTDLEGQRALKEADYNLQRLAEQRGWHDLGGRLAGNADTVSRGISDAERAWVDQLARMGIDASRLGLDRTNAGADAARAATADERTRGQDYFNNQLAWGDRLADLYKATVLPGLDNDAALFEDASSGGVAAGNAAAANERTNAQDLINLGSTIYGMTR